MSATISPLAPKKYPKMPVIEGVRIATAEAGIKYRNRTDLLAMVFDPGTAVAGVFTRSKCPSAPVDFCRQNLPAGKARVLVVNSGNANAFTGKKGRASTALTGEAAAKAAGCSESEVFLASTGVIGEPLDTTKFSHLLAGLVKDGKPDLWEIRVMAKKAVDSGLDKDADFQRRMAFLQARALHGEVVEKEVVDKVTDAEVRARYDQEIANTPPVNEVHARHILVKTKEEAEAIIKQLDGGADFQKLANEHTNDPSGKTSGGDLGWFGPGQMVPEFDKAAFALDVGKYTKEPVQTQFGWHVIKLEDKRAKQPPAFDEVKDQAKQAVIRDKYFAMVKDLRAAAKVEIPDEKLKKDVDTLEAGK